MTYLDRPLADLLTLFSDPAPTPGGGSASALAAALGLSLIAMVAQMGRTRSGSDQDRRALDDAAAAVLPLRDHVAGLIEDDARAYDAVVAAYRLPRTSDDERTARKAAVQSALRGAAEVPLDVMRACQAGLTAAIDVGRHGNPAAASDIGVALELLATGLRGAALNVRANLGGIDEAGWVDGIGGEVDRLEAAAPLLAGDVRAAIGEKPTTSSTSTPGHRP
jgi:methenyltetrahydrofolate cyclohydrolase